MQITALLNSENTLVLSAIGRIDSTNAAQAEAAAFAALKEYPGRKGLVVDAEQLEYISSAGLRVILKLRKTDATLKIINVSPEVYDIFEMTGFSEMLPIEKAFRQMSVEGCTVIGRGAKGIVYRYNGDTIVKVYKNPDSLPDIMNERELARKAFVLGIPTAISYDVVKVGQSYGSVFELLDAKSFSQLIAEAPESMPQVVQEFADLLRQIHSTRVKATDMPDIKKKVFRWLDSDRPVIGEAQYEKLFRLVDAVPETLNMLHCDYHTNNVMMQNGEALLIDMDTLAHGHPIFELANVFVTYVGFGVVDPDYVGNFLGLPYPTAVRIWDTFLPLYLQTDDAARIAAVDNRARLLGYARYMHHALRRSTLDNPTTRQIADFCAAEISRLLAVVDDLTF